MSLQMFICRGFRLRVNKIIQSVCVCVLFCMNLSVMSKSQVHTNSASRRQLIPKYTRVEEGGSEPSQFILLVPAHFLC